VRKAFLGVLVVLMAGCGAGTVPSSNSGGEAPAELKLAVRGESEDGYDPTLGWGRYGSPLFQSTLLRRNADLEIVNDLATGYEVSDDGLVWTVRLRDDATFTDGTPVTAKDVAYTFTTASRSGGLTDVTVLDTATEVDEYAVELRLKQPQSTFLNRLITLGIVPAHLHGDGYARNPVGSGPFKMVRWDEGQQMVVEANPDYYGEKPAFQRIVFLFTDEDATLALAKAGQVHIASLPQNLASQQITGMELVAVASVDNRGIMMPWEPANGRTTEEGYPIGNAVTSNLAVRQAVNLAVDRRSLVSGILDGHGNPAIGPVDGLPWFEPQSAVEDNRVDEAKRILSEDGWEDRDGDGIVERDGVPARFTLVYPADDTTRQGLALTAAQMVKRAGVQIDVQGLSWSEIEKRMHTDAVLFGWGSHDQTEMYNLYHSRMGGTGFYNTGFYVSPPVDGYMDAALGATDPEEANVLWRAAQFDGKGAGFGASADAVWAWLVNLDHTYLVDECLDVGKPQVEPHGHGYPITAGITSWTWSC